MLISGDQLASLPLASVRSAARIGHIKELLINPHNLHIDALLCQVVSFSQTKYLSPLDIRDISVNGFIIDDHDNLFEDEDAVRLRSIIDINFKLVGKAAYVGKKRVGQVSGFSVDSSSLYIQQIYVNPSIMNRLRGDRLIFSRSNVKEVTDQAIFFNDSSREAAGEEVGSTEEPQLSPSAAANAALTES